MTPFTVEAERLKTSFPRFPCSQNLVTNSVLFFDCIHQSFERQRSEHVGQVGHTTLSSLYCLTLSQKYEHFLQQCTSVQYQEGVASRASWSFLLVSRFALPAMCSQIQQLSKEPPDPPPFTRHQSFPVIFVDVVPRDPKCSPLLPLFSDFDKHLNLWVKCISVYTILSLLASAKWSHLPPMTENQDFIEVLTPPYFKGHRNVTFKIINLKFSDQPQCGNLHDKDQCHFFPCKKHGPA